VEERHPAEGRNVESKEQLQARNAFLKNKRIPTERIHSFALAERGICAFPFAL